MAALNQAKIIKGLREITSGEPDRTFFFKFLKLYGFPRTTIQKLEHNDPDRNIALREGDYGLTKQIFFREAKGQDPNEVLESLLNAPELERYKIRFFIVTDFERLVAYDRRVDDSIDIDFSDLANNFDFFLPLTGQYEKPLAYAAHPADIKACEKMGRLYDAIRELNHYENDELHGLNVFLARLLFCYFAEDTGIFLKPGQMTVALESMTAKDGSDLPQFFETLFAALGTPEQDQRRLNLPATIREFPFVNEEFFSERGCIPKFNTNVRRHLIAGGKLSWREVSPVIFGSMFQSVMDPELRRELGAHYTSEKNIFKVIGPLFLDGLNAELENILGIKTKSLRKKRLKEFQEKLASIRIGDPACGSGNFLVVSYRELKMLELRAVKAILDTDPDRGRSLLTDWMNQYSKVSIDHFYGMELEEFPAYIARVSMWLMEHVMKQKFGALLGAVSPSLPLEAKANIACVNALTSDWTTVFPAKQLSYIIGNPPFGGALRISKSQKAEVLAIFPDVKDAGKLDYVTCWYQKATQLMSVNPRIECAFVSTNSICQGEQVAPLWGKLFSEGVHINFAHQTFQWRNEARGNAGVYCVVVGFSKKERERKFLYQYENPQAEPVTVQVNQINAYLLDAKESVFIRKASSAISADKPMFLGNMPNDGGNLIIEPADYATFWAVEKLRPYIKKLIGSRELLHSEERFCLWLHSAPEEILKIQLVAERIERCRSVRLASRDPGCRKLAQRPHEFRDLNNPESCIVVPRVSSERREYIPIGFIGSDTILTDLCHMVPNGTPYDFGILESRMHMVWMRTVCGRLESRYRYSRNLCYNTFPWPQVSEKQREQIENLARNILMIRESYPGTTLADLYDPDKMPSDLRKAHYELDVAVERLYRRKPFQSDEERLSHLFRRYEKLVSHEDDSSLFNEE